MKIFIISAALVSAAAAAFIPTSGSGCVPIRVQTHTAPVPVITSPIVLEPKPLVVTPNVCLDYEEEACHPEFDLPHFNTLSCGKYSLGSAYPRELSCGKYSFGTAHARGWPIQSGGPVQVVQSYNKANLA